MDHRMRSRKPACALHKSVHHCAAASGCGMVQIHMALIPSRGDKFDASRLQMECRDRLAVGADAAEARRWRRGVASLIGRSRRHSVERLLGNAVSRPVRAQLSEIRVKRAVLLNQNDEVIEFSRFIVWVGSERAALTRAGLGVGDALATMQHQDEDASYHKDKEHIVKPR